jgi:transcriptional regulator with XRE-family HTH domain
VAAECGRSPSTRAHEKHVDRAERARRALADLGRELRIARLNHDLSQRTASRAAGMSQPTWSRLESGGVTGVALPDLARALAVVGLDLSIRAFPAGSALRDRAHVELLERLRVCLGPGVRWATEVPLPSPGDRRAWDALAQVVGVRIGIEAETRARDSQELQRRLELKRHDGRVDHVMLLLADTRHNRAFVRAAGEGFRNAFPVPGRIVLDRLASSADPGGSGIVLL